MVPTMPTRELYVQGTQEPQPPGIEPPHWTTEDYRSRRWAVYVSFFWGGGVAIVVPPHLTELLRSLRPL